MEKTNYNSFDEIDRELNVLQLERQIAAEKIHSLGIEIKESFTPNHIFSSLLKGFKDFGVYYLIKKLLK